MSKPEGFAAVPIWMIRDKSIPRNAILVYASLSSRAGMGAIFPSQATIAEESGVSERTVRTMLGHLESRGLVERHRRSTKGKKRVTDGYSLHPGGPAEVPADVAGSDDLPERQAASTGNGEQITPLIEIDKEEIDKDSVGFDDFWSIWPRKDAKKNAEAAWNRAVRRCAAQVILDSARAYAEHPNRPEKQYVPHAATWLNGDRWTDPLPEPRGGRLSVVEAGRQADAILAGGPRLRALS